MAQAQTGTTPAGNGVLFPSGAFVAGSPRNVASS